MSFAEIAAHYTKKVIINSPRWACTKGVYLISFAYKGWGQKKHVGRISDGERMEVQKQKLLRAKALVYRV